MAERVDMDGRTALQDAELDQASILAGWQSIRDGLRRDLGARTFDQWIRDARLIACEAPAYQPVIALPSSFVLSWVEQNHGDRIRLGFKVMLPECGAVRMVVQTPDGSRLLQADAKVEAPANAIEVPSIPLDRDVQFDARMNFDRFVTGKGNLVAHNAARSIADGIPNAFNPLFIHGGTGQGKTHLLHAIGQRYRERRPDANIVAMSAERFMVGFVSAIRSRETIEFKARLRAADLLMIDDVHFISGKGPTQEEFLHTVDEILGTGRQLVITADRPPHMIDGLDGRIQSRLGMGLVADIVPADHALRLAILRKKAELIEGATVPTDVLDLLAGRMRSNIRELEGALNRVVAYASLQERTIDLDFAQDVLRDMLASASRRITIDEIQRSVSSHFRVPHSELMSNRRSRAIARPRQIAMYLAKKLTPRSLPEIGRKFGRDHSTVIHAVRQIDYLRTRDSDMDADIRALMRRLENGEV